MIEKRNYAGLSLDPVPTKYVLLYVLTRRYDCSLGYYLQIVRLINLSIKKSFFSLSIFRLRRWWWGYRCWPVGSWHRDCSTCSLDSSPGSSGPPGIGHPCSHQPHSRPISRHRKKEEKRRIEVGFCERLRLLQIIFFLNVMALHNLFNMPGQLSF